MTAPLVDRLIDKINKCVDGELRAVAVAELACYWARVGEFEEAERLRSELRGAYGDGKSAQVSIMIMCLEALLMYYKDLNPEARDRMLRASLLSKSFRIVHLGALTAAWMAHIDFNQNRLDDVVRDLADCFNTISTDDEAALCRVSLVLGDAFLFVDDEMASKIWYDRAHRAAVRLGDQAAIGAITYNRAGLHISMARFRALTGAVDSEELARMNAEVQTAINYQAIAQVRSLDHLLITAKVGVLMLGGQFAEAEPEIERLLSDPSIDSKSSQRQLLLADLALIRARGSRLDGLLEWIESVPEIACTLINADDRAILLNAASSVAGIFGRKEQEVELAQLASAEIDAHWSSVFGFRRNIDRFRHFELIKQ